MLYLFAERKLHSNLSKLSRSVLLAWRMSTAPESSTICDFKDRAGRMWRRPRSAPSNPFLCKMDRRGSTGTDTMAAITHSILSFRTTFCEHLYDPGTVFSEIYRVTEIRRYGFLFKTSNSRHYVSTDIALYSSWIPCMVQ